MILSEEATNLRRTWSSATSRSDKIPSRDRDSITSCCTTTDRVELWQQRAWCIGSKAKGYESTTKRYAMYRQQSKSCVSTSKQQSVYRHQSNNLCIEIKATICVSTSKQNAMYRQQSKNMYIHLHRQQGKHLCTDNKAKHNGSTTKQITIIRQQSKHHVSTTKQHVCIDNNRICCTPSKENMWNISVTTETICLSASNGNARADVSCQVKYANPQMESQPWP